MIQMMLRQQFGAHHMEFRCRSAAIPLPTRFLTRGIPLMADSANRAKPIDLKGSIEGRRSEFHVLESEFSLPAGK